MNNAGNNEIRVVSAICPVSELSKRNISGIIRARINYGHHASVRNIFNDFKDLNLDTISPPPGEDTGVRISPREAL
jgi:hypothetical protein